ncbi:MAG: DUF7133 domain-containing protein, partial [Planctomycetota bacterium]
MRFNLFATLCLTTFGLTLNAPPAAAQRGDRKDQGGEVQREVWKEMDVPAAPPLTPEQALAAFKVAPGFRVELVAAEPLVEDPVAMEWDARGRLWVVEMRGYMPNVDGKGEDQPVGQVVVLEDTDHDGKMDRSTVFLDKLVMPRAITVVEGGVLIAEPPNLWYCRDTDGDLKCDEKTSVYDKYGRQGPVEHTDSALTRALDNWLYNTKSNKRIRFDDGQVTVEETTFRGQWGLAQDNYGRIYTNANSNYLRADLIPDHYAVRNPSYERVPGVNHQVIPYRDVHTIRVNPGVNRGYREETLRADGRLARITASSGLALNRGGVYPSEYDNAAFIPEPAGNVVTAHTLYNDGVEVRASHNIYKDERWTHREFLASTDERFRPVSAYLGPDGCIYVTDLYRGILQHAHYVTTYLRKQIIERGLETPLGLGRIWRIIPENADIDYGPINLQDATSRELAHELNSPNGWRRDTAQRLLVERGDESVVDTLRSLATYGDNHLGRIHALWTLHGMGATTPSTVLQAITDPHPRVRIAAAQTAEVLAASPGRELLIERFVAMTDDRDESARLQAMLTLGAFSDDARATAAMADLLLAYPDNAFLRG